MNCRIEIRLVITIDKSVLINHFHITIMNCLSNIMKLMTITLLNHVLIYTVPRKKSLITELLKCYMIYIIFPEYWAFSKVQNFSHLNAHLYFYILWTFWLMLHQKRKFIICCSSFDKLLSYSLNSFIIIFP